MDSVVGFAEFYTFACQQWMPTRRMLYFLYFNGFFFLVIEDVLVMFDL